MSSMLIPWLFKGSRAAKTASARAASMDSGYLDALMLEDRLLYSATPLPDAPVEPQAAMIDAALASAVDNAVAAAEPVHCGVDAQAATEPVASALTSDSGEQAVDCQPGAVNELLTEASCPLPHTEDAPQDPIPIHPMEPAADDCVLVHPDCDLVHPDGNHPVSNAPWVDSTGDGLAQTADETNLTTCPLAAEPRHELVLIDQSIQDIQQLVDSLLAEDDPSRDFDIVYLDAQHDGLAQIDEALAGDTVYDDVHFVAHGDAGSVRLGTVSLDIHSLQTHQDQIRGWSDSLSPNADLLFYACDLTANADGQLLVSRLHELTGADVAASVDLTGHSSLGGDWDLEFHSGQIETNVAFDAHAQQEWLAALAPSTTGTAIWRQSGSTTPEYTDWDGVAFGTTASSASVGSWRIMQGAEAPTRDEIIVAGVNSSNVISGEMWNGSSWSALSFNNLATVSNSTHSSFDVAYESQSGDAILVWSNGTTGTTGISYRVWNGSSWSAEQNITSPVTGEAYQMQLVADANSDEMILAVSNAGKQEYALVWNGSSWVSSQTLDSGGGGNTQTSVYAAYESQSGEAIVVYDTGAGTSLQYRTWNGTSWSGESSVTAAGGVVGAAKFTTMASDPSSDRIALGVVTASSETWLAVWDGSSWGSKQLATSAAATNSAPNVDVAFESQSGDLLAAYGENNNSVRYRTWTSGGGWSSQSVGPNIGAVPNSMTLDSDPNTNQIVLSVQDNASDLNYVFWNGASWGSVSEKETNTGETANQPFLFLFDQGENIDSTGNSLWLSTTGDQTSPGMPGVNVIGEDEVLRFGDPNLDLEPGTTSGTFSHVLGFDDFAGDGNAQLDALHYVSQSITLGSGGNTLTLQAGDVLFSTFDNETLTSTNSLAILDDEVILFRPDAPGNYSSGTFTVVLDNFGAIHGGNDTWSLALVEQDTVVGDVTLAAGSFLFSRDGGAEDNDIRLFTPTGVGAGGTAGSVSVLIEGDQINISPKIYGLELITHDVTIGGVSLASGTILVNLDGDDNSTGSNSIATKKQDVFFLTVSQTTLGSGTAAANATLLLQGTDVGMDAGNESIDALALFTPMNAAPVITSNGGGATATVSVAENSTAVTTVTSTDLDGGSPLYSISGGADAGLFTIDGSTGALSFLAGRNREVATDADSNHVYEVTVRVSDGAGGTDTQVISVTITDVDEFDVGAVSDANAAANAVNENAANGTVVGLTALASDADATTNTITYTLDDNAGGRFAIGSSTGVVTVANGTLLNREAAAAHGITVRATSADGSFSTQTFTINLNDVDEFDVVGVSDSNAAANAVNESAANGTVVGLTALASDPDATTNTITYTLDDNAEGRFAIDSSTGIVTVADGTLLNREAAASHNITIRATSADNSFSTQTFTINLNDVDEFNVGPLSDTDATTNAVDEAAATGTVVGLTALASDADATTNAITYTLDDDAGGRFAINSTTGVVTVADGTLLDYETAVSHSITVRATSQDGSFNSQVFTIQVNNINEAGVTPISDTDAAPDFVLENSASGSAVGLTAFADDVDATDTVSFSLDDDAGGRFAIDASTGVVTVADGTLLDREAAASHNITVRATSSDSTTTTRTFTITVGDADEFDVGAVTDGNLVGNAVNENAATGTPVGITAVAADADATNNTITYTLDDDAGGRFAIAGSTGVVTVADGTLLDREAAAFHSITVRATSADSSFSTQTLTINLNDVDEFDVASVSDSNAVANAVNENAANGASVGITALASDADATTNTITYTLDDNAGGRFAIDGSTGVVTVADGTLLDREAAAAHNITIRATSADGSFNTQAFTINLNDVDEFDVAAVSDSNGAANAVNENASTGTVVGIMALASDADATTNTITYSLDDDVGGRFAIDATSGVVTVADGTLLDREAANSHNISVRATSTDGSFNTQIFTINLNDVDEFDVAAVSDSNGAANAVNENASTGTVVGVTASASDADATNNSISYTLDDDAGGRFAIDSTTGEVTVADGTLLDREAAAAHNITVRATSADGSFNTQAFTINLNDADEFDVAAVSDSNGAANAVNENASNGAVVGVTALASDADATNNSISYTLDDDAGGRFAIDSTTGVVTVADGTLLDREAATSHNISVRATSSDGSFSTQVFTINLNDVDEFDVGAVSDTNATANAVNENAANGTVVGITALASDADATTNTISYALDDDAGGRFAIDSTTGVVTVADGTLLDREAAASHNITIRATSADGSFSTQIFSINLNAANDNDPIITSNGGGATAAVTVAENSTAVATVAATDADLPAQPLTYTISGGADAARFTIDAATGDLHFVAAPDFENPLDAGLDNVYDVVVEAQDGAGGVDTQLISVTVTGVNEAPVVHPDELTVSNIQTLTVDAPGILANDSDPEGDSLNAVLLVVPQHGNLVLNADGSLTYTPDENYVGLDSFAYQASDGSASSAPVVVQVMVISTGGPAPENDDSHDDGNPGDDSSHDEDDSDDHEPPASDGGIDRDGRDDAKRPPVGPRLRDHHRDDSSTGDQTEVAPRQRARTLERESATYIVDQFFDVAKDLRRSAVRNASAAAHRFREELAVDSQFLGIALHQMRNEIESSIPRNHYLAGAVAVASAATTAGYVLWALRSAHLVTAFFATLPAWCHLDPLPLLNSLPLAKRREEGESLLEIAGRSARSVPEQGAEP